MVGPIKKRGRSLVYHRGRGKYSKYSPARDRKRKSKHRMKHWSPSKRKRYKHTSD